MDEEKVEKKVGNEDEKDEFAEESAMSMSMVGSPSWVTGSIWVPSSFGCSLWLLCGAPLDRRDLSLGYSKKMRISPNLNIIRRSIITGLIWIPAVDV